jgi:arylsulfatase
MEHPLASGAGKLEKLPNVIPPRDELRRMVDKAGLDSGTYGFTWMDATVGAMLDKLAKLGIADNTLFVFVSDNGTDGKFSLQDHNGTANPCIIRWPGVIKPGSVSNGVVHHMDWMPTFLAAAGKKDIKEDLLDGYTSKALGRKYKIHLDGYDLTEHLKDPDKVASPRKEIFYFSDDGDLTALRYEDWKLIFMEQKSPGTFRVWMEPFVPLRVPLIENLRRDPYERAEITSNTYFDWMLDRAFLLVPAQAYVGNFLATFKEYPPRMKAASFSLDQVMEKMMSPAGTQ